MSFDFQAYAVTGYQASSRVRVADLSVEEARDHVKVVDGNIKKPVEGFQGLTLKLSRVKISLDAVAPKAAKIQVPNDQVEAASEALLAEVAAGTFDEAIEAGLAQLNAEKAPVVDTPADADLEEFEEDE